MTCYPHRLRHLPTLIGEAFTRWSLTLRPTATQRAENKQFQTAEP